MGFYADHVFPLIDERLDTPELGELRADALRSVEGRVVELGFGAARNLPFHPASVTALTAVEPTASPGSRWGHKRIAAWRGKLDLVVELGERLPFDTGTIDTVVMSYVLCTVADVKAVLKETRRILRPGGRYIFMEHVASSDRDVRALQERVAKVGIWRRLACGCEPNRETEAAIRDAEFEIVELSNAALAPARRDPIVRFAYKICPMIYGVATKPG